MNIPKVSVWKVVVAFIFLGLVSTNAMAKEDYNIKYFGQCGALYDGDRIVTSYSATTGKTTAFTIGKGCKNSHPDASRLIFSNFDSLQIKDFYVRGMKTNKEGMTRRTIIRKEGARYRVRGSVVK